MRKTAEELIQFIKESPDAFHAAAAVVKRLQAAGYEELKEKEHWEMEEGKGYFVTRNDSAVIAFRIPEGEKAGYQIMACHSDSPTFKINGGRWSLCEIKCGKIWRHVDSTMV